MMRPTLTPEGRQQVAASLDRAIENQRRTIREHEEAAGRFFAALQDVTATRRAMLQARRRLDQAVARAQSAGMVSR